MPPPPQAPPPPPGRPGLITVPGRGTVRVDPDVASIRFGVAIVRPTAAEARAGAGSTMESILAALSAGGVERRDQQTTLVGLDAVRDYSSGGAPRVTGYQLTNSLPSRGRIVANYARQFPRLPREQGQLLRSHTTRIIFITRKDDAVEVRQQELKHFGVLFFLRGSKDQ